MANNGSRRAWHIPVLIGLWVAPGGCFPAGERVQLQRESLELRDTVNGLERTVARRESTIAHLQQQISTLQGFDPARRADLFAPVKIEIAGLSGGADYDRREGDDGVSVYVRPRDAYGDVVKVPGRITVQLLDNSDLAKPRALQVYRFDDPKTLQAVWYGKFGTQHYSLKCPFPPGVALPPGGRLTVAVEFIDYLTGRTLTATREVTFSTRRP